MIEYKFPAARSTSWRDAEADEHSARQSSSDDNQNQSSLPMSLISPFEYSSSRYHNKSLHDEKSLDNDDKLPEW